MSVLLRIVRIIGVVTFINIVIGCAGAPVVAPNGQEVPSGASVIYVMSGKSVGELYKAMKQIAVDEDYEIVSSDKDTYSFSVKPSDSQSRGGAVVPVTARPMINVKEAGSGSIGKIRGTYNMVDKKTVVL